MGSCATAISFGAVDDFRACSNFCLLDVAAATLRAKQLGALETALFWISIEL
jgi:hypothetical protein